MIPTFPVFKLIELDDGPSIEALTRRFPPYSDYNFVSLWCWNAHDEHAASLLHDNLVVRFKEYGGDRLFLSFLGTTRTAETATTLITYAAEHGLDPRLRLIPEIVVETDVTLAHVEDPGSADYVLSIPEWVVLPGHRYRHKRNAINRFERQYAPDVRVIELHDPDVQAAVLALFDLWAAKRGRAGLLETEHEREAVQRAFAIPDKHGMISVGIYVGGILRGFSINQRVNDNYAIGHFWKADHDFVGIYPYLLHMTCVFLSREGYEFLNIEQDLGQSGLAYAKRLCRPYFFLRKYILADPTDCLLELPITLYTHAPEPELVTG